MNDIKRQELLKRNNIIVEVVMKEMQEKCPDAVDLIGIAGSFCNGDIYEKSDLDLVIISNNDAAKTLDKCFIIDDVGFDVYTGGWDRFESMAEYDNPYVTKLFDLNIIYTRDEEVLEKYKSYQKLLQSNMKNTQLVNTSIGLHFSRVLEEANSLKNVTNIGSAYRKLANIINKVEFILYMVNRTYIKLGTKRIPEEIATLKVLPQNFLEVYNEIIYCKTIEEIQRKVSLLINPVKNLLDNMNITYELKEEHKSDTVKRAINQTDLIGTYEEIYSNWRNKMYHAIDIKSPYLSFMTMKACQDFYDEMSYEFDIPKLELLENYNPNDLKCNATFFDETLKKWKELYNKFNIEIKYYPNLEEFKNLYKKNNIKIL